MDGTYFVYIGIILSIILVVVCAANCVYMKYYPASANVDIATNLLDQKYDHTTTYLLQYHGSVSMCSFLQAMSGLRRENVEEL